MANATQAEIKIVAEAIAEAGLVKFSQFLSSKLTDAQWQNLVPLAEAKRKELKNAEIQRQIAELQAKIEP